MYRSLEKQCRRSAELQELLSAAQRRSGELSSTTNHTHTDKENHGHDESMTELKSQLNEQLRRTSELQALLNNETRKLSADTVGSKRRHHIRK